MGSGDWKSMDDDRPDDDPDIKPSTEDSQYLERRRRKKWEAIEKSSRKYLQDVIGFLWREALAADESLKFEYKKNKKEGTYTVRLHLGGDSVESTGESKRGTKEEAAKLMLKQIGPYIEEEEWKKHAGQIAAAVPEELRDDLLPPRFDAHHVPMMNKDGLPFKGEVGSHQYEVAVSLGPLTAISITDSLHTSLHSLASHLINFLSNRDLSAILAESKEENLKEMEVPARLNQPYVQTSGLIDVRMEGPKSPNSDKCDVILQPVDLVVMQENLPEGKFPPLYGVRDCWNCIKVFYCHRCMIKMNGVETLQKHVKGIKHWRKIGKFFINGQLRETFNPVGDPFNPKPKPEETEEEKEERIASIVRLCKGCEEENKREIAAGHCEDCDEDLCGACRDAHTKTRLTKNHVIQPLPTPKIKHPKQDEENGDKVERDNIKYLIAVYRCTTNRLGVTQRQKQMKEEGTGAAFAPPPTLSSQRSTALASELEGMYENTEAMHHSKSTQESDRGHPGGDHSEALTGYHEHPVQSLTRSQPGNEPPEKGWDDTPDGMGQMGLPNMGAKQSGGKMGQPNNDWDSSMYASNMGEEYSEEMAGGGQEFNEGGCSDYTGWGGQDAGWSGQEGGWPDQNAYWSGQEEGGWPGQEAGGWPGQESNFAGQESGYTDEWGNPVHFDEWGNPFQNDEWGNPYPVQVYYDQWGTPYDQWGNPGPPNNQRGGFNHQRGGPNCWGNRGGGNAWGRGGFNQQRGGHGGFEGGRGFNRGRGGFDMAQGGFNRGRGGYSMEGQRGFHRGRGGFDMGQRDFMNGRGGFDMGQGGFQRGRGIDRGRGGRGWNMHNQRGGPRGRGGGNSMVYESQGNAFIPEDNRGRGRGRGGRRGVSSAVTRMAAGGLAAITEPDLDSCPGNMAYTGMMGKSGFSDKNTTMVKKFSALPPPGHSQWSSLRGSDAFDNGDQTSYSYGQRNQEKKISTAGLGSSLRGKSEKLGSTADWYNTGPSELELKSTDRDAILHSIEETKKLSSLFETDFTKAPKPKKPRTSE